MLSNGALLCFVKKLKGIEINLVNYDLNSNNNESQFESLTASSSIIL